MGALAVDINNAGFAVGYAEKFTGATDNGQRAVLWGLDGIVIDLNTLIDPTIGWTLWSATDISNTGWIAGAGFFDPDGVGSQPRTRRMFLMQIPATAVPEPATIVLAGIGFVAIGVASCRRLRRSTVTGESSQQNSR
jgi:hypothetical protein